MEKVDLIIVGSGLFGLTLSNLIKEKVPSKKILLLEKSKGVGGRVASRRMETFFYNHGAQYYSHSDAHPFLWHARFLENNLCEEWGKIEQTSLFSSKGPMTGFAKELAKHQDVRFDQLVKSIQRESVGSDEKLFKVFCEKGDVFECSEVIFTPPLPQSLEILQHSMISYPKELDSVLYAKALVGLFMIPVLDENTRSFFQKNYFKKEVFLKADPLKDDFKSEMECLVSITFHSLEESESGFKGSVTVVMNDEFSSRFYQEAEERVLQKMDSLLRRFIDHFGGRASDCIGSQLKKWRYSHPQKDLGVSYLKLEEGIVLAGDAFCGGSINRVVGAAQKCVQELF